MKKFLILFLILFSTTIFGQVDTNLYLDLTKKEIKNRLKENFDKVKIEAKLCVVVDSLGKWTLDDNHYTYLFTYREYITSYISSFTFDNYTNKCEFYYIKVNNLDPFYFYYIEYFDKSYEKEIERTVWYDRKNGIKIIMHFYNDLSGLGIYYEKIKN